MPTRRIAVIDLGSNTFHLLIVDLEQDGQWISLLKDRRYVKLASGGLDVINEESLQRGIAVMKEFAVQIKSWKVDATYAVGTAAMREAANGMEVARILEEQSGIPIEIIDGQQEADYILKGIQSALPSLPGPGLIMDIGGGSVEFILFQGHEVLFVHSYKIGVALLYERFHKHDPILPVEINALTSFLETELAELINKLKDLKEYYLIGASGSFEVIQDSLPKLQTGDHWNELDLQDLDAYMSEVIPMDLVERKLRKEIPAERLDYIVVAYLLIRYIIRASPPSRLYYCDYALKEGVIAAKAGLFQ